MRVLSILLALASLAVSAQANEACRKAGVGALTLVPAFWSDGIATRDEPIESADACMKPEAELRFEEKNVLAAVRRLHESAAGLFGLSVEELLPSPVFLTVYEDGLGYLNSGGGSGSIELGTFPDSRFAVNAGVYLHELGHVLASATNPKLPAGFEDFGESILLKETFSDFLAIAVSGTIQSPHVTRSCLDRVRSLTTAQSYRYPVEYFTPEFTVSRIHQCCRSIERTSDPSLKGFCKTVTSMYPPEDSPSIRFSGEKFSADFPASRIDPHQIGIPFLSFFGDFGDRSGISSAELFRAAVVSPSGLPKDRFRCSILRDGKELRAESQDRVTIRSVLRGLRAGHQSRSALFDRLEERHGLKEGYRFSQKDWIQRLQEEIGYRLTAEARRQPEGDCPNEVDSSGTWKNRCTVVCREEK